MSRSICLHIKTRINRKELADVLDKIFNLYDGYFSKFSEFSIGRYNEFRPIIDKVDISNSGLSNIDFNLLPNEYELGISLSNLGSIWILNSKKGTSFSITLTSFGFHNVRLFNELMDFAEVVLNVIDSEAFIICEDAVDFFDYKRFDILGGFGAKSKDEIIKLIRESIARDYIISDKDIEKEIKRHTKGFKRFANNFIVLILYALEEEKGLFHNDFCNAIHNNYPKK